MAEESAPVPHASVLKAPKGNGKPKIPIEVGSNKAIKNSTEAPPISKPLLAPYKPKPSYPNRLDKDFLEKSFKQLMLLLCNMNFTIPFSEAIKKIP